MSVVVNGRRYSAPSRPVVVVCLDGFDPAYLEHGLQHGLMPNIAQFCKLGYRNTADAVLPTFTNPNNMSIISGASPAVHGISGNYYLDRATGKEIMITDDSLVSSDTILAALANDGVKVAAISAKEKLRKLLGHGLRGICFSAERAGEATQAGHGIENVEKLVGRSAPDMYNPDLSLFVLDAGIKLLEEHRAEVLYLSTSDLVQHSAAPGEQPANEFHQAVDERLGRLASLGAVLGVVADHGMSDKCDAQGRPNVVYLETQLNEHFGAGAVRVICPITDPYVRHHGALGSFVRVYVNADIPVRAIMERASRYPGVALVLDGSSAALRYNLPPEREGDFIVTGDAHTVLGSRVEEHELGGLKGHRLRSHGGLSEQSVPFIVSRPLKKEYQERAAKERLRNFDIFDFVLNGSVDRE